MTNSIRFRTALALGLVVTLSWLAAAALTQRILAVEMNEVFDAALQETGQRILQLAVIEVLGRDEDGISQVVAALNAGPEFYSYIVRSDQGQVLLASQAVDLSGFPSLQLRGFQNGTEARFYQQAAVQGSLILTIAEPLAHRAHVAMQIMLGLALPLLVVIPLSLLGILTSLGIGLRPLGQLRNQLERRDARDLTALDLQNLPMELQPIAASTNNLLHRLASAFEAERSFAWNAAHELRTPLAGAIAQLQRLRQQSQEPATIQRVQQIEQTLKRLTRLSEKLIQLARAEGAQLASVAPYDLRMVLTLVRQDFSQTDAGRLELDCPDQPVLSVIDPDAVAIIARNLFENALRHGDGGGVLVRLTSNGLLQVENGGGVIAPQILAALSDRFARGTAAAEMGSGLGLAIVRTLADRLNMPLTLVSPIKGQKAGFSAAIDMGLSR